MIEHSAFVSVIFAFRLLSAKRISLLYMILLKVQVINKGFGGANCRKIQLLCIASILNKV